MKGWNWLFLSLIAVGAFVLASGGGGSILSPAATAATYVYEKDDTAVPNPVRAALDKLNRREGFIATAEDDDAVDATGAIADQYKVPFATAKTSGIPVLVVTAGDTVLKIVKDPKTEEDVLQAVP